MWATHTHLLSTKWAGTLVFIPSFNLMSGKWASPMAQLVKNPATMQETQVTQV